MTLILHKNYGTVRVILMIDAFLEHISFHTSSVSEQNQSPILH